MRGTRTPDRQKKRHPLPPWPYLPRKAAVLPPERYRTGGLPLRTGGYPAALRQRTGGPPKQCQVPPPQTLPRSTGGLSQKRSTGRRGTQRSTARFTTLAAPRTPSPDHHRSRVAGGVALLAMPSMLHGKTLSSIASSGEVRDDSGVALRLRGRARAAIPHCGEPWPAEWCWPAGAVPSSATRPRHAFPVTRPPSLFSSSALAASGAKRGRRALTPEALRLAVQEN